MPAELLRRVHVTGRGRPALAFVLPGVTHPTRRAFQAEPARGEGVPAAGPTTPESPSG